jgi:hypothetical protein
MYQIIAARGRPVPRQNHRRNNVYSNEASVGKFGEHENGQVKIQQTAFSLSAT